VALTVFFGAGALLINKRLGDIQADQLRQFDKGLTVAKTDLGKQEVLAADAAGKVMGLEQAVADAKAEMAKQETRAAVAERSLLELQQRLKPRHLNSEQQKTVAAKLRIFAGQKMTLVTHGGDTEITGAAKDIAAALSSPNGAEWVVARIDGVAATGDVGGILIEIDPDAPDSTQKAATALATSLGEYFAVEGPKLASANVNIIGGHHTSGQVIFGDKSVLKMTIGKKP
jgi:hypothetical protein